MDAKPSDAQGPRNPSEDKTSLADVVEQISELSGKLERTTQDLSQIRRLHSDLEAANKKISDENESLQKQYLAMQQILNETISKTKFSEPSEGMAVVPYELWQRFTEQQIEAQTDVVSRVDDISAYLEAINSTLAKRLGPLEFLKVFNANQTPFAEAESTLLAQIEGANLRPRADSYSITRAANLADAPVNAPAPGVAAP